MKKALGLMGLAGLMGCADFHARVPVSEFMLGNGRSVEITDGERNVVLEYTAPLSGDGEMDDIIALTCYETFCYIKNMELKVGGSGRFYAFGMFFDYRVENDNDGDPLNNVLGFSARSW